MFQGDKLMEMTIREAIRKFYEKWMQTLNCGYLEAVNRVSVIVTIPLNSGVRLFIDTYVNEDVDKNGIFRRLTFDITGSLDPYMLNSDNFAYMGNDYKTYVVYGEYVHKVYAAKEKDINRFISDNGGINVKRYNEYLDGLFTKSEYSSQKRVFK